MNKKDLVELIAESVDSSKADAERTVEKIIDTIIGTLKKGDDVAIAGLGKFVAKKRNARTARNPRTGETVNVPATTVPKFTAAKAFKDEVAGK
jgi:DNA-binding protein HU-beta